jgi:hypothetical protein
VFNAVGPEELLIAVGRVLREAARAETALDDYGRSQLLSAYSITRNMAAEQAVAGPLLHWVQGRVDELLADSGDAAIEQARVRIAEAGDGRALGEPLSDLLRRLAADPARAELRAGVRGVLHEMVDREVTALAEAPR